MKGFSLTELLVSVAIALLLIVGAITAYARIRVAYLTNETVARLQEEARYALGVIAPDIELAGYFGFARDPQTIAFVRGDGMAGGSIPAVGLRQSASAIAGVGAAAHACGRNFAVDVLQPMQGSNNVFVLGPGASAACGPYAPGAQPGADTLTTRRTAVDAAVPEAGRIQIRAARLAALTSQLLFADGHAPGALDTNNEIHDFLVRTYYVAQRSVDRAQFPALRVKALTSVSGAPAFTDSEVMPGIEDLQIELGAVEPGHPGQTTLYAAPGTAALVNRDIVAVRIWLRVRAEFPEPGFDDDRTYRYADVVFTPAGAQRLYRRVLLARTVAVRNARQF